MLKSLIFIEGEPTMTSQSACPTQKASLETSGYSDILQMGSQLFKKWVKIPWIRWNFLSETLKFCLSSEGNQGSHDWILIWETLEVWDALLALRAPV